MTVKENEKEISALEKEVEALKAQLDAANSTGSGNKGFKVTRPRPTKEAREQIEAARTGKMKTYRALEPGTDYRAGFIARNQKFTTDQPQGSWMEEVDGEPDAHANQFAVGPDLNARIQDTLQKVEDAGGKVQETDKPRKGKSE